MNTFIEIPANKSSITKRKLLFGVGTNDADYIVSPKINGRQVRCPYYQRWVNMIERCYSTKTHKRQPTYKDCRVCNEWLVFSKFKDWMITRDWKGLHLDKDLLVMGNKVYAPNLCLFVPHDINNLLGDSAASRGEYPQGVNLHKPSRKFRSSCSVNGDQKCLGYFDTVEGAARAYRVFKSSLIRKAAQDYRSNSLLYNSLNAKADSILLKN